MPTRTAVEPIPKSLSFRDDEKPYVELIVGAREPKMSPKLMHGKLQGRLAAWLEAWGGEHGEVAVEWRCYLLRGENRPSSLVPDVAYMSYERLPRELAFDARQRPRSAPDIVVEIWSPGDRKKTMAKKMPLYFAHGCRLVILVYPEQQEIALYAPGTPEIQQPAQGKLSMPGYPDLTLDADALFRSVLR